MISSVQKPLGRRGVHCTVLDHDSVGPVVLVCSGGPPASECLLQVHRYSQGQMVLHLTSNNLHPQGQTFLAQTQRTLGNRQPEDVQYT